MAIARVSRADRKQQTRDALVDSAYALFTRQGFHRTSLDQVSAEAGFTKGAVYSNFSSKEDLFFAVYERRVETTVAGMKELADELGDGAGRELARRTLERRRDDDDGWMAVFFEFWAHVLRHPELRARFVELHTRARRPMEATAPGWPGADAQRWTLTMFALVTGLGLEQLTDPGLDAFAAFEDVLDRLEA